MNKWITFSIVLLLMFSTMMLGFMIGYDNDAGMKEGYDLAIEDMAQVQLEQTVIFIPINGTVEKIDLVSVCGWEDGN